MVQRLSTNTVRHLALVAGRPLEYKQVQLHGLLIKPNIAIAHTEMLV